MTTLVLSPRDTEDGRRLGRAAEARGWTATMLRSWRVERALEPPLVLYGEPLFCRVVAAQVEHLLLEPPHEWLLGVPEGMRRRRIELRRFDELANATYPAFVKPPDDKIFAAAAYDAPDALLARTDIPGEQAVLVSQPVRFVEEHRVHVLDGAAVSASRYAIEGEIAEGPSSDDASTFAEAIAVATPDTPPAVVIDVGRLEGGEWAVVEANPAFGAGIYAGDADRILDVLRAACLPGANITPDLERFTFPVELEPDRAG